MTSEAFVLEMFDYQIDYNIKLAIFGLVIGYTFFLYWYIQRIDSVSFASIIFEFFAKIYMAVTIFFLPLFTIMLFRNYDAIDMWTLLLQVYGIVFVIAALALLVFGWEKVLQMFGLQVTDISEMKLNKKRRGEA